MDETAPNQVIVTGTSSIGIALEGFRHHRVLENAPHSLGTGGDDALGRARKMLDVGSRPRCG